VDHEQWWDNAGTPLLKGIVRPDGSPGPHFAKAQQFTTSGQTNYFISVARKNKTGYTTLPGPTLNGAPNFAEIRSLYEQRKVKPAVATAFSLTRAGEALAALRDRRIAGHAALNLRDD